MSKQSFICPKCDGRGYLGEYDHVEGGICFRCDGTGYLGSNQNVNPDNLTSPQTYDYEVATSSAITGSKIVNFDILGDCRIDRVGDNYTCFCIKADATFTFTVKQLKHSGFREIHNLTSCSTSQSRLRVYGVYGQNHLLKILEEKIKQLSEQSY